jgi:serum/glucocorticoid-regulated kinase 2
LESYTKDLSSYELLKVIGKGTFGKVILARSKEDSKVYALKCLKKEHILRTKNIINLRNEKRIIEKLDSPFIVKLKFTFQTKEKIFMGFEYFNGGELFFHLHRNKVSFSEDVVRFYTAEIYLALRYLHKNGIVYRDLKPENIILDDGGHVKLIDFGLAKDNLSDQNLTGTFCGTNEYIPPELLKGEKYSFNFDWWGYGVLLYEMLFGKVN